MLGLEEEKAKMVNKLRIQEKMNSKMFTEFNNFKATKSVTEV